MEAVDSHQAQGKFHVELHGGGAGEENCLAGRGGFSLRGGDETTNKGKEKRPSLGHPKRKRGKKSLLGTHQRMEVSQV